MPTVCHFITTFWTGGTERQFLELLRGLDRRKWTPLVLCFRKEGNYLPRLREIGVEPHEIPLGPSLASPRTLAVVRETARFLAEEGVSLLHCHDVYTDMIGVAAARLARVPVIASRRDLGHHVTRLQRPVLQLALRSAQAVLANAAAVAARIERDERIPAERIAIVPNGLDLEAWDRAAARTPDPLPVTSGRRVLTVARMTYPAKGHADLLEAAALALRVTPDLDFYLAGDGPLEPALGRRADVPALLARADFAVHPSRAEGMPNAVLEAMAAGRPIVATAAGGVPEILQHDRHGLLTPPADPASLAAALVALAGDPVRARRLGRAARARVEARHSIGSLIDRIDRLYEALTSPAERERRA